MISKAFILGAGLGNRLQPLTSQLPKPLVPVFHRPLVCHTLDRCLAAGIEEFAINTHHLPETWEQHFPDKHYQHAPLHFFHEEVLLETGGGIKNIESFIDQPTLVHNGDILTDIALPELIAAHEVSNNIATLALRSNGELCNIAVEGNQIVDLRHARGIHPGTHQFTGVYCIEPEILDLIPANEKISIVPAFLKLAEQGRLGAYLMDEGRWLDIGTLEAYFDVHRESDLGSAIHPNASISESATLHDTIVGPGCTIGDSAELSGSILWPNTHIKSGARLTNCIVYSSTPVAGIQNNATL